MRFVVLKFVVVCCKLESCCLPLKMKKIKMKMPTIATTCLRSLLVDCKPTLNVHTVSECPHSVLVTSVKAVVALFIAYNFVIGQQLIALQPIYHASLLSCSVQHDFHAFNHNQTLSKCFSCLSKPYINHSLFSVTGIFLQCVDESEG